MYKLVKTFLLSLLLLIFTISTTAYTWQFADQDERQPLRWKSGTIPIAISSSLLKSSPNVTPDSDVMGAVKKSLETWEKAAAVKFEVTIVDKQSVSPSGKFGDGVSLITIAQTPENAVLFGGDSEDVSARTRVFYSGKGFITEADVVLNPYQRFSTNGALDTFDLESTLTHEIGHLLGLEHSNIAGATMYAHQGKNGIYNVSAFSSRTLSEDDVAGIRALYGVGSADENCCGTINGKLLLPDVKNLKIFQVWVEDSASGRVAAGVYTDSTGNFKIEGLSTGTYRAYAKELTDGSFSTSDEFLGETSVVKGKTSNLIKRLNAKHKDFSIQYVGFNNQISDLSIPLNRGKSYTIFVGGKNLDPDSLTINFNSPYLSVMPNSLNKHDYGDDISVFSFEIKVNPEIPKGDYSFYLQNKNKEIAYFIGGLTIEDFVIPGNSVFTFSTE